MVDFIEDNKIKLLLASEMEDGNFDDLFSRYCVEFELNLNKLLKAFPVNK